MKLHQVEIVSGAARGARIAVPGGWLYCKVQHTMSAHGELLIVADYAQSTFVPDPTAEHVTHGAGGAAVGYSKAIADCLEILARPSASHSDCVETIGALRWER